MLALFRQYIDGQHLFSTEQEVLLAVSGGRDSVAMADLMQRAGYRFAIAHCNFHLRPADCDRDQQFVCQLAQQYHVPFLTVDFDTNAYASVNGYSIEEAARLLRYEWFARLCREHGYACVATAHHRDDSIETFFLNLFRGTGIAGLHGIRPKSVLSVQCPVSSDDRVSPLSTAHYPLTTITVVRPLLCFSRADVDRYIAERGLAYVEDSTNAMLDARRNQLRHRLMPLLRELYPSVDATMQANIDRLADTEQVYRDHIAELRRRVVHPWPAMLPTTLFDIVAIGVDDILCLSPRCTLLYELLQPYGFNAAACDDILQSAERGQGGRMFLSPMHVAELHRGQLLVAPQCEPSMPEIDASEVDMVDFQSLGSTSIVVDADRIRQPMRLRLWRDGDRFHPFGMQGSRLVSDFVKDCGLPLIERRGLWLLVDAADRPVWLVGLRADNSFRVTTSTASVLRLTIRP